MVSSGMEKRQRPNICCSMLNLKMLNCFSLQWDQQGWQEAENHFKSKDAFGDHQGDCSG